jgi:hypothetical protein
VNIRRLELMHQIQAQRTGCVSPAVTLYVSQTKVLAHPKFDNNITEYILQSVKRTEFYSVRVQYIYDLNIISLKHAHGRKVRKMINESAN